MTRWLLVAALLGAPASVDVRDNTFSPATKTVAVGDRVTFTNRGQVAHEVSGSGLASGNLAPGASWTYTAAKAGSFPYVCRYHPGMNGTLVVSAGALPQTGGGRELRIGIAVLLATAVAGLTLRSAR